MAFASTPLYEVPTTNWPFKNHCLLQMSSAPDVSMLILKNLWSHILLFLWHIYPIWCVHSSMNETSVRRRQVEEGLAFHKLMQEVGQLEILTRRPPARADLSMKTPGKETSARSDLRQEEPSTHSL